MGRPSERHNARRHVCFARKKLVEAGPRVPRQKRRNPGDETVGFFGISACKTKLAEHVAKQDCSIWFTRQKIRCHREEITLDPTANPGVRVNAAKEQLRPRVRIDG